MPSRHSRYALNVERTKGNRLYDALKRKSARRPFQDAQHSGHIPLCVAFQLRLAGWGVEVLAIPGALPISNGARSARRDGVARPRSPAHPQHARTLYSSGRQPRGVPRTRPPELPAAASAYRPNPANRALRLVAYKQLRPQPDPPSPPPSLFRAAHIRVAVGPRSPLRGFLKVSYTQQLYLPSNSYGIVG